MQHRKPQQDDSFFPGLLLCLLILCTWSGALWAADPLDNWHVRAGNAFANGIAYGNGLHVAVGNAWPDAEILVSADGRVWGSLHYGIPFPYNLSAVTYGGSLFVAVGQEGHVLTSPDGMTWTAQTPGTSKDLYAVAYGGDTFAAVGDNGVVVTSRDGMTWSEQEFFTDFFLSDVAYGNGVFIAVGDGGTILKSSDHGITWRKQTTVDPDDNLLGVDYGNGVFVAAGVKGDIRNSLDDGETWTEQTYEVSADFYGIAYGAGFFSVFGGQEMDGSGIILTSSDGATWTQRNSAGSETLFAGAYGSGGFVALSYNGTVIQSDPMPAGEAILTVNKSGAGDVASDAPGIACGRQCTGSYPLDTVVTLTAVPVTAFVGWSGGGCSGSGSTCTVTMESHKTVTATFAPSPSTEGPAGSITINGGASSTMDVLVVLALSADDPDGVSQMQFSGDSQNWSVPEGYMSTKAWTLSSGDGPKDVYVRFRDGRGNWSDAYHAAIILDTVPPVTTAWPAGGTYGEKQQVTLLTNEPATIFFTTDGIIPTQDSSSYTNPFPIEGNMTLNYFAQDAAGNIEAVKTAVYRIISPVKGDLNGDGNVDLRDLVLYLRMLNGEQPTDMWTDYFASGSDPDGNGKIGLQDVIFVLQKIAGVR